MKYGTQTILIVDDEAADLDMMSGALRRNDFRVFEAGNSDMATSIFDLHREEIDLLLTDISLPGNNGCELARTMLKHNPDLKVLFVSGYTGSEVCRYYGLSISDMHFLSKPFNTAALLARVKEVLSSEPITIGEPPAQSASCNTAQ